MKKILSGLTLTLAPFASLFSAPDFLQATPYSDNYVVDSYVSECYHPCFVEDCAPRSRCLDGLYVFGEYLYWKADMDNTPFCTRDNRLTTNADPNSNPPNLSPDAHGKYHFASLNWSPGFRAGIGIPFPHDNWKLVGCYTYHYSEGRQRVNRPSNPDFVIIGMFRENVLNYLEWAKSNINLKYESGDVMLTRRYQPSSRTSLRLAMGFTGGWFNQNWTVKYSALSQQFPVNINRVKNDWEYYGGGGRVGIDFDWQLDDQISFFGLFTGAVVVGRYKHHYFAINPNNSTYPTGDAAYNVVRYVPNTQVAAGLNWNLKFCGFKFDMSLAYEINCWWNVNPLPVASYLPSSPSGQIGNSERYTFNRNGNICFQGFTGRMGIVF